MKDSGWERLRLEEGPLQKLVLASLIAAVTVLQCVREREGTAQRPVADAFDADNIPALEAVCESLEGKTLRQKNPHPKGSLAYAAWVLARLGGWTGSTPSNRDGESDMCEAGRVRPEEPHPSINQLAKRSAWAP